VVENLLPSLVASPPDVETLRLYLTLPFYHEFDNPKNYLVLHNPFGRTFLTLKTQAGKIVGEYFISYFEICSERCIVFLVIHLVLAGRE
jgi:E3 ubiquitin-protein ligase HERC4